MKKKLTILFTLAILLSIKTYAQNDDNKWTIGVHVSSVIFGTEATKKVKDGLNTQFPAIQISRSLAYNFSADFIYTSGILNPAKQGNVFKYTSFDTYLRYDFPELFLHIVPFGGIGFGYIKGATTVSNPQDALSLNFMGGGTLWISERFGLTGKLIYKHLDSRYNAMAPHVQGLAGLVYRFDVNSGFGQGRTRLWNMKH